jgi:hypothetical protein
VKLSSHGFLQIDGENVRIKVSNDFGNYYKHLIDKHFKFFTNSPAHGCHISLFLKKLHGKLDMNRVRELRKRYYNKVIRFSYDPYIYVGGGVVKGFHNYYMNVEGFELDYIVQFLGVKKHAYGFHLTVSNTKGGVRPYILK